MIWAWAQQKVHLIKADAGLEDFPEEMCIKLKNFEAFCFFSWETISLASVEGRQIFFLLIKKQHIEDPLLSVD